jgi:hypothetical protein
MSVGQEVALLMGEDGSQGATIMRREETVLGIQIRTEIESAYVYAKHNPRSEAQFMRKTLDLCTINEEVASECMFAVPRAGKMIEGPSARFAEIIFSVYKNCQVKARIISEGDKEVIASATFLDLENNAWQTTDVSRPILDKHGRKFNEDMIRNAKNAAIAIARRNAIFIGIPKALWIGAWKDSRKVAIGDAKTLANKRSDMLVYFQKMGVTEDRILATLELKGIEDIGLDELARLKAMANSMKEGDQTGEELFPLLEPVVKAGKGTAGLKDKIKKTETPKEAPEPEKTAPQDAPGSTIEQPAVQEGGPVSAISAILRGCTSIKELDETWKKDVEGGTLEKIDKKKLAYVYQEVNVKLHNS